MSTSGRTHFRFGAFDVDVESGRIHKHRRRLTLDAKALELLVALLERPGDIVSREDLKRRLWQDDVHVEFDKNLNNAVGRLRVVLGDSATTPRFIETLPRKGYRFIGEVERVDAAPASDASEPESGSSSGAEPKSADGAWTVPVVPPPRARAWAGWRAVLATGVALAMTAAVVTALLVDQRPDPEPPRTIEAIAVLPFLELSAGPLEPHVTDGITESLILELSRVEGLRVTSRASSAHYQRAGAPIARIADELGVDAIVDGTVQREGDRIRVTVQLIHATAEAVAWSKTYDRQIDSVLDLQREAADTIALEIKGNLQPNMMASLTRSRRFKREAVDHYLRGRHLLARRTPVEVTRAREYFEQALALEPSYAQAHAGIALAWEATAARSTTALAREALSRAREAADRALALDGSLVEARIVLAIVSDVLDRDPAAAQDGYERALKMNPSHPLALLRYAVHLRQHGRLDAALTMARRAHARDPLSLEANVELGLQLHASGDTDAAIRQMERTIELDNRYFDTYVQLVPMYLAQGRPADALVAARRGVALGGGRAQATGALSRGHAASGNVEEARRLLESVDDRR